MWRRRTIEFDWWGGGVAAAAGCRFVPKDKETPRTGNLASGKRTCHIKFLCGPLGTNAAATAAQPDPLATRSTTRFSRASVSSRLAPCLSRLSSRDSRVSDVSSRE